MKTRTQPTATEIAIDLLLDRAGFAEADNRGWRYHQRGCAVEIQVDHERLVFLAFDKTKKAMAYQIVLSFSVPIPVIEATITAALK